MIQYSPPVKRPSTKIQKPERYQGNFLACFSGVDALALADALEEAELLIMIGLEADSNCSTCFPHLGQTTHS